ncbi:type IIL restriction-modification enzyme MmeI, partial [Nodularia chucula]|uniref:type IIL restriction-modification enzyme MmeI n=1 Tax=Nodularia chucula TaxID=3093667 RepID=UPI0039C6CCB9
LLGVPAPNDVRANDPNYSFEQVVRFDHLDGTTHWGFIDCYRRGCFVLEMKQSRKRLSSSSNVRQMDQGWSNSTKRRLENAQT